MLYKTFMNSSYDCFILTMYSVLMLGKFNQKNSWVIQKIYLGVAGLAGFFLTHSVLRFVRFFGGFFLVVSRNFTQ